MSTKIRKYKYKETTLRTIRAWLVKTGYIKIFKVDMNSQEKEPGE
jgi:hypothetical protein